MENQKFLNLAERLYGKRLEDTYPQGWDVPTAAYRAFLGWGRAVVGKRLGVGGVTGICRRVLSSFAMWLPVIPRRSRKPLVPRIPASSPVGWLRAEEVMDVLLRIRTLLPSSPVSNSSRSLRGKLGWGNSNLRALSHPPVSLFRSALTFYSHLVPWPGTFSLLWATLSVCL